MEPVEIFLLFWAIVADTLAKSFMFPSLIIYVGKFCSVWFGIMSDLPPKPETASPLEIMKIGFLFLVSLSFIFTLDGIYTLSSFLDDVLQEFVPTEGLLHSAVDKVLKGIAFIFLAVSVFNVALPLANPNSNSGEEEELSNLFFWTFVFLFNLDGADLSTTRQDEARERRQRQRGQTSTPNINAALLTPPNRPWNLIDASLTILFVVSDMISNYLAPSLTILIRNFALKRVHNLTGTKMSWHEVVINLMVYVWTGISICYSWNLILSILTGAFSHLAPPGGIHRSTIVQILCTVNGVWFVVAFYKMIIEIELTSQSLDSDGVMTSLAYWALTSSFLVLKKWNYDPPPTPPPRDPRILSPPSIDSFENVSFQP